ncbi:MAG: transglycosylase domain-containing protein, partial [Deltaproteobacteria bacterium]|nr:transglycosylase domain-containing protein [Deltaproteobacteria bacterium]
KSATDLSLSQCALIAGMPKAPSRYSPLVNRQLSLRRPNIVLRQMKDTGAISDSEYQTALEEDNAIAGRKEQTMKAPYFIDHIKSSLEDVYGATQLYKGGLSVYTTLSHEFQSAAEAAVRAEMAALETRMQNSGIKDPRPQCALISIDIPSGGILAMVGGRDYSESPYNRATHARRQPGSAFKPIVYALAVERGFSQDMLLLDAPVVFKGASAEQDWQPENFSRAYRGEITMRSALALSKNIPAIRLLEMLGPSSAIHFAQKIGLSTPMKPNLSLALGTSEVRLIDLTTAYCVFAGGGRLLPPSGIMEVQDHRGRLLPYPRPRKQIVISEATAAIMTDMLQAVVAEGTGRKAASLGRPLGGKTGTTDQFKDALFIGFSPTIATGVWVGLDRHATLGKSETGARAALPIWIDYMGKALQTRPYQAFDIPKSVSMVHMDPATGKRLLEPTAGSVKALFRKEES